MSTSNYLKNETWADDWDWNKFMEILSAENSCDHQILTSLLRRLQLKSFKELRKAIEDTSFANTSWDEPWLRIQVAHPWESIRQIFLDACGDEQPATEVPSSRLALLNLFVAGAAVTINEGMEYPLIPIPLLKAALIFPIEDSRHIFERWLSYEKWMNDVSYGDEYGKDSDIENGSLRGSGRKVSFKAALVFRISPLVVDNDNENAYNDITVGIPWKGTPPTQWTQRERNALWKTVVKTFELLIEESDKGEKLIKRLVTKIRKCEAAERHFDRFEAILSREQGPSFSEKTSFRSIERSTLGGIPRYARGFSGCVLCITDGNGTLDLLAVLKVLAVMCHPDNIEHQRQLVASHQANIMSDYLSKAKEDLGRFFDSEVEDLLRSETEREVSWNPTLLKDLISAPSYDAVLQRAIASNLDGAVAGEILKLLFRYAEHAPEHASVRKAIHVVTQSLAGACDRNGRKVNSSRASITRAWSKFRPVAHLWAAFRFWEIELGKDPEWALAPDSLLGFLAVAEQFRKMGVRTLPPGDQAIKHGPILDPTTTWRVPPDLELPDVSLESDLLPGEISRDLEKYRARR